MIKYYLILLIMTILGSVASFFLKKASSNKTIKDLILNKNIYIGGFLYLFAALLNVYILKYLNYSVVLPLTAITYIWTMLISYKFLKEKITFRKMIGVSLIIIGVIFVAI